MAYVKTNWVDNTTPINENNLNKIESGIKNNDINIGEENYDNTKTYEVGDIVRYNEKIYKCITAITTAENFDISKWEQTNIVEIVQSEKSKIYELIEAISTPIVGEGENITLNDTAEKRFENFDIEGNSEQETREGYNKLPIKFANATNNGITLTVKDNGKLLLNGTSTSTALFNAVLDNEISLNNYIFKIKKNSGTISVNNVQFFLYTTGYTSNQNISVTPTLSSSKTTLSSNAYTVERIVIPAETTLTNVELEVMISETEKQYEQYGASPSPDYPSEVKSCGDNGSINEVISNKNLFDKNTTTDGKYIGGNGSIQTQSNIMYSDYIQIKTNINYYITGRSEWASVALYDKNKTFLERISTTQPNGVLNITNSNCKYIIINALLTDKDTLQLEEGSTATTYIEHQSQSYIIPVQQEMLEGDYFDWDNEEEVHTWNKLVLNGTENIGKLTNDIYNRFHLKLPSTGIYGQAICNYYKVENSKNEGQCDIDRSGTNVLFHSPSDSITTVEQCKNWIKLQYNTGTPVTIYYKTATPTRLPFTDEQKAVAKKLNNARTYKNVTHIYSNDEVSPNCYVEAVKDLTTLIQ